VLRSRLSLPPFLYGHAKRNEAIWTIGSHIQILTTFRLKLGLKGHGGLGLTMETSKYLQLIHPG
jgi:hypothetical protein